MRHLLTRRMHIAVNFDDDFLRENNKVDNVSANRRLSSNPHPFGLELSKHTPKHFLALRLILSQGFCKIPRLFADPGRCHADRT